MSILIPMPEKTVFMLKQDHKAFTFKIPAVFKIRSETCRTEAQFCQNLYIFIYDKEGMLAGPTPILPVNVRGPALILKTVPVFYQIMAHSN